MFDNKIFDNSGGGGGGSSLPAGSDTYVQFNDGGTQGGDAGLVFDKTKGRLGITNNTVGSTSLGSLIYGVTTMNWTTGTYGASSSLLGVQVVANIAAGNNRRAAPTLYYGTLVDKSSYSLMKAVGWFRHSSGSIADGETATIDGKVYTFRTGTPAVEGEVKIGASSTVTMSNFMAAINGTGTLGVEHYCTAHTTVDATSTAAFGYVHLQAKTAGAAGEVAISEASAKLTVSGATLVRQQSYTNACLLDLSNQFDTSTYQDQYPGQITGAALNLNQGTSDMNNPYCHMYGFSCQLNGQAAQQSNTRGDLTAYTGVINVQNCTTDTVKGMVLDVAVYSNGIAGTVYGIDIAAGGASGSGAATTAYALYIGDWSAGASTAYGLYIAGATQNNYIEGNLTVAGTLTANVAAAGSDTQIQFNDGGSFAGASGLLYDKTNIGLTLSRVADDALGPAFVFQQSRGAAGQVGDVLGAISFKGYNDNATPELIEYAQINSTICYPNDGGEGGSISFKFMQAGTLEEYVRFNVAGPSGYSTYFDFKTYSGSPVGPTLRIYAEGNNGGALVVDGRARDGVIILSQELSEKWRIGHNITNAGLYLYSSVSGYTVLSVTHESATKQNIVFWGPTNTTIPATANKNLFVVNGGVAPTAVPVDMTSLWCADYAAGDARLSIMGEKNTNTLTLGAGNVLLRPDTMADDSVSGETFVGTAGEDLAWGDVVYMAADGKFYKADADSSSTAPAVAFCTATISADASGEFLKRGWIRDDSAYNFTNGPGASGLIYLSTDAGAVTQTAPSGAGDQVQVLGWAYTADIWYFEPQLVVVEV